MAFPKTLDELKAAGYSFSDHAVCRGCGEDIEWWETPLGKKLPMNPMERGVTPAVSHFATCLKAERFRRKA
jgi:hypothetical protein